MFNPQAMLNGMMNFFGGPNGFQNKFNTFVNNFQQTGVNPQQMVEQMLNDGRMTQEQFNQLRAMANQMTGRNL
jgi:hypothetical protein